MTQMVYTKDLKPLLDDRYIKNEATIIPNGSSSSSPNSLNNYMGLGFYYQSNPANITELPESGKAFFLLVEDFGTKNYTKQTLTHTESNKTYTRIRNNGLWGSWREISADTTYNNVVANGTSGLMSGADKAKLDGITAESTASKITMNGTRSAGELATYARGDHIHPSDTSKISTSAIKNDLTTGGASNVLSAEQGKWLYNNKLGNQEITNESQLDLNHANYQTPGTYYCTQNSIAQKMSHTPWQTAPPTSSGALGVGYSFSLVVLKNAGVTQILKPSSNPNNKYIYIRSFSNSQWTEPSDSGNFGWYKLSIDGRDYATNNHNQASSTITDSTSYGNIGNSEQNQKGINSAINTKLGNAVYKSNTSGLLKNNGDVVGINSTVTSDSSNLVTNNAVKAYVDNIIGTIDNWLVQ